VEGELETALGDLSRAIGLELLADADWTTIATVAGFPVAVERVVIGDKRVVLTSMASSFVGPGLERERSVQRVDTLRTLRVLGVLE